LLGFKQLESSGYVGLNFPPLSIYQYFILGIIVAFLDIIGDVCESFVKRLGQVKDSGTFFFTGHGGACDRFDGFYFIAPVSLYYLHFIVLGA